MATVPHRSVSVYLPGRLLATLWLLRGNYKWIAYVSFENEIVTARNIQLVALLSVLRYYFETRQMYCLVHVYQRQHKCTIDHQGYRQ